MNEEIIIAGAGGQGVMLLGKILAEAAMREDKFTSMLPAYGAEVRGGTAHCMVVISDREIGSPYIEKASILVVLNGPSLERFKNRIRKKGLLIINSSLASSYSCPGIVTVQAPFTDKAKELGNIKVANIMALGCLLSHRPVVGVDTVESLISDFAPADKKYLAEINIAALKEGGRI
ncbi:MAG: 2-oxoacid:acceptor oxidoreductase family protein [Candidatus Omnitrophica bacterium]|nr:2-oxoacid:acceptor oxidoreductase family protein [Candidatus Omnitrophota bacterium]